MCEAVYEMDAAVRARVRRRLLAWYDREKRDLPWRRRASDPYAQMLAEFMLQQTQVATVVGYYERFVERFPTVADLAGANLDDVLTLWSGLGYYSRARNLHAAARRIVDEHGGVFPSDVAGLMGLPGIGRYTAGAIASIAFGCRAPVLDGNVIRVLARLTATAEDPGSPALRERFWRLSEALLPRGRCGDFNQALMELGATLCTPKSPNCAGCPVRSVCRACATDRVEQIPPSRRRARVQAAEYVVAAVRCGSRLLFRQRPATGLWAGLWELPSEPVARTETHGEALDRLGQSLGRGVRLSKTSLGSTCRQLTHRRITFHVFRGRTGALTVPESSADQPYRWLNCGETSGVGISSAARAVVKLLDEAG